MLLTQLDYNKDYSNIFNKKIYIILDNQFKVID